jgi:hypothetical protein
MPAAPGSWPSAVSGEQIHARVWRDSSPGVAAVFAVGAIDYRVVTNIIMRTENVEQDVGESPILSPPGVRARLLLFGFS